MNIIEDIRDIIATKDHTHHIRMEITSTEMTVYLEYDPELEFNEDIVIPITYDLVEEDAYIPHKEYIEMFNAEDFGLDLHQIKLIGEIMEYMISHGKEIEELCLGFCAEDRKNPDTEDDADCDS